jgi:predicted DNA-binding transcriptional regulator YafY
MPLHRYIGRIIDIIYLDRSGHFTKRRIRIISVSESTVKAYCYTRRAVRTFTAENILAAIPVVNRHAG